MNKLNRIKTCTISIVSLLAMVLIFASGWRQNDAKADKKPAINAQVNQPKPAAVQPMQPKAPQPAAVQPTQPKAPQPATIQQTQPKAQPPAAVQQKTAPKARWHQANLERHWEKHGAEFPEFHSAKEYGDAALNFFANPPKGTLQKQRPNGERLYYHPPTNTFGAAAPDGTPKTLFRPSGRMNYWNRQ